MTNRLISKIAFGLAMKHLKKFAFSKNEGIIVIENHFQ